MWADIVQEWDKGGLGYECINLNQTTETAVVNHLIFADNVYIIGSGLNPKAFQQQLNDFTLALHQW
eukprot:2816489-Pyramimonas_sp.AAC.1